PGHSHAQLRTGSARRSRRRQLRTEDGAGRSQRAVVPRYDGRRHRWPEDLDGLDRTAMIQTVVSVPDSDTVAVWDGVTRQPDDGRKPVHMILTIPDHGLSVGDKIQLIIKKQEPEQA